MRDASDLDRLLDDEASRISPPSESFREALWARTVPRLPRPARRRLLLLGAAAALLAGATLTWFASERPETRRLILDDGELRSAGEDLEVRSRDVKVSLRGAVSVLASGTDLAARTQVLFQQREIPMNLRIPRAALAASTLFLYVSSGHAQVETAEGTQSLVACQAVLADGAGVLWLSEPQAPAPQDPGPGPVTQRPEPRPVTVPDVHAGTTPPARAPAGSWFVTTEMDLGVKFQEDTPRASFRFTNPTGVEQKIVNLLPSCGCTKAELVIGGKAIAVPKPFTGEIAVPPGAICFLEVEMDLKGVIGEKTADIRVQTTDPAFPLTTLHVKVMARAFFVVSPDHMHLGEMLSADQRTFAASVTSPFAQDWNIVRFEGAPAGMKVTVAKDVRNQGMPLPGDSADHRTTWSISGTYGPGLPKDAGGGTIRFFTDVDDRSFTLSVSATVLGALKLSSRFVSFGHVPLGTGKMVELELTTPLAGHQIVLDRVEFLDLQCVSAEDFSYETRASDDGRKLVLSLTIKPEARRCHGRGKIRLHLSAPEATTPELTFNVFVR